MTAYPDGLYPLVDASDAVRDDLKYVFALVEKNVAVPREEDVIPEAHIDARFGHFNAYAVLKLV